MPKSIQQLLTKLWNDCFELDTYKIASFFKERPVFTSTQQSATYSKSSYYQEQSELCINDE